MNATLPLSLHQLLPVPLRERFAVRTSALWQQDITWNGREQIFIQAPSGTGKTTLIHILYGMRTDYDGTVKWGSDELGRMDVERVSKLRREAVSVIFQDLRLFPALTAWENLEIKRVLTNSVSAEDVRAWMEALGI